MRFVLAYACICAALAKQLRTRSYNTTREGIEAGKQGFTAGSDPAKHKYEVEEDRPVELRLSSTEHALRFKNGKLDSEADAASIGTQGRSHGGEEESSVYGTARVVAGPRKSRQVRIIEDEVLNIEVHRPAMETRVVKEMPEPEPEAAPKTQTEEAPVPAPPKTAQPYMVSQPAIPIMIDPSMLRLPEKEAIESAEESTDIESISEDTKPERPQRRKTKPRAPKAKPRHRKAKPRARKAKPQHRKTKPRTRKAKPQKKTPEHDDEQASRSEEAPNAQEKQMDEEPIKEPRDAQRKHPEEPEEQNEEIEHAPQDEGSSGYSSLSEQESSELLVEEIESDSGVYTQDIFPYSTAPAGTFKPAPASTSEPAPANFNAPAPAPASFNTPAPAPASFNTPAPATVARPAQPANSSNPNPPQPAGNVPTIHVIPTSNAQQPKPQPEGPVPSSAPTSWLTHPHHVQPQNPQPQNAQPQNAQPQYLQPQHVQPQNPQPQNPQPQNAQPQSTQPQHVQPQYAQPQNAQPQNAQPQNAQPQNAQPQNAQPQYAQPQNTAAPANWPQAPPAPTGSRPTKTPHKPKRYLKVKHLQKRAPKHGKTPHSAPGRKHGKTPHSAPGRKHGKTPHSAPGRKHGKTPHSAPGKRHKKDPHSVPGDFMDNYLDDLEKFLDAPIEAADESSHSANRKVRGDEFAGAS